MTIVPLTFIFYVDIDMVLLVGMHINKVLYSMSYTCVTTGVAGILFVGIYIMVRYFFYFFKKGFLAVYKNAIALCTSKCCVISFF